MIGRAILTAHDFLGGLFVGLVPANVFEHAHCIPVIQLNSHLNIFEAMRSALLLISHHLRISIGLRELPKLCPECLPETLETEYFGGAVSAVVCFSESERGEASQ